MKRFLTNMGLAVALTALLASCGRTDAGGNNGNGGGPAETGVYFGDCYTIAKPFGAGEGTLAKPYQICSVSHLQAMADLNYATKHFILVTDIDLINVNLYPVPNFSGTFDGQNNRLINWGGNGGPFFESNTGTVQNIVFDNANAFGSYRFGVVGTNKTGGTVQNIIFNGQLTSTFMSGAIVGLNSGIVDNCHANVVMIGGDIVGALVGWNWNGTISNSSATGSMTGVGNMVGGLVGANSASESLSASISNSFATNSVVGVHVVGGLIGCGGRFINLGGGMTAPDHCATEEYTTPGPVVHPSGTVIVDASYATGNVNGTSYIGGFMGRNLDNTVNDSYARGRAQGTTAPGYVGGFIGRHKGNIATSYSTGIVSGPANTGGFLGGLETGGNSNANCFWDTQTSGIGTTAGTATGRTTVQMQTATTFSGAGWDGTTIWFLVNGAYPTLR